jgi:hypothetical protein
MDRCRVEGLSPFPATFFRLTGGNETGAARVLYYVDIPSSLLSVRMPGCPE